MELGEMLRNQPCVRGFIALAAIGHRRKKWRVGFDEERGERNSERACAYLLCILEGECATNP